MDLEALSTSELLNYIIYDTLLATPFASNNNNNFLNNNNSLNPPPFTAAAADAISSCSKPVPMRMSNKIGAENGGGGCDQKKRRRKAKVCKNKEDVEAQRMTHITIERNRRKQMNEHLAVLRSFMPESYAQRGDQASIVGGAIEYVKELEHVLQSLQVQKSSLLEKGTIEKSNEKMTMTTIIPEISSPFSQFFSYPQYKCSEFSPNNLTTKSKDGIADIEVTLIESHANVRALSRRRVGHVSKMVAAFHSLYLTIIHLNVTTFQPLLLYSITAKVEEGCELSSSDEIASAVHHVLKIIEEPCLLTC